MSEFLVDEQPPVLTDVELETVDRTVSNIAAARVNGDGETISEERATGVTHDGTLVSVDYDLVRQAWIVRSGIIDELTQGASMAECEASPNDEGNFYFRDGGTTLLRTGFGDLAIPSKYKEEYDDRPALAGKMLYPISELKRLVTESSPDQPVLNSREVAKQSLFKRFRRK